MSSRYGALRAFDTRVRHACRPPTVSSAIAGTHSNGRARKNATTARVNVAVSLMVDTPYQFVDNTATEK
jgi:hypothetical protein